MAVPATGRNRRVALLASGVAVAMLGLAFASVPLYRMFCQVTGFGGTTQRAEAAPQVASASSVSVRFDANTSNHLAWSFHPAQTTMNVKFGEQAMAHYRARNTSNETITASAIFNVTPPNAGVYFNKIQERPEAERAAYVAALRDEYREDIDLLKLASELVVDAVVSGDGLCQELVRRFRLYAEGYQAPAGRKHGVTPV